MKKYGWLVCGREKYCSGWKFTVVYDKPQPNEQAACYQGRYWYQFLRIGRGLWSSLSISLKELCVSNLTIQQTSFTYDFIIQMMGYQITIVMLLLYLLSFFLKNPQICAADDI